MIKITIIIILILLLIITLYSYYCLSSRMINFERARLEYILQKESELGTKEKNIKVISDCSNKNEQLENALTNINKIIGEIGINNSNNNTNTSIHNIINESVSKEILNEVPEEYLNSM